MADTEDDPFLDAATIEGLEHLGRAITDKAGVPSGSPANYEFLRGQTGHPPVDVATITARLAADPALTLPGLSAESSLATDAATETDPATEGT